MKLTSVGDGSVRRTRWEFFASLAAILLSAGLLVGCHVSPVVAQSSREISPEVWINDLSPIDSQHWSYELAAHLFERAGFGETPAAIETLAEMSPSQAVDWLLDVDPKDPDELPAFEASGIFHPEMLPIPKSRADAVRQGRENGEAMGVPVDPQAERPLQDIVNMFFYGITSDRLEVRRAQLWWANRMLSSERPLQEKMALFWHGHFATSNIKVRDYRKLLQQLELFHAHGLRNFRTLLLGITQDPGMLVFLDNGDNVKAHPNENFGRELMELFSMGDGNYTERDIREASRAFTGWTNDDLAFVVNDHDHDTGTKTVLGQTGEFDGEQVIDIILSHTVTAEFVAAKIYRYFVRSECSAETRVRLGAVLRDNGYELKPLMRTILLSKDFYSPASVGTQIKSPVQLAVSTYKKLGLEQIPTIPDFNSSTRGLGQELFHPPNVAGWAGGRTWITPATLLERGNFASSVLFASAEGFYAPDRNMPGVYRQVGERIASGMSISEATGGGKSSFSKLATADEQFNTRYGAYMGYVRALQVVKPIPRFVAPIDLAAMVSSAETHTAEEVVDYFIHRFLRVRLSADDRDSLIEFARGRLGTEKIDMTAPNLEQDLRALLHLVMSAPEYQLS